MKATRWRIWPLIRYINYRKEFPSMSFDCCKQLFSIKRAWRGQLIFISVKHWTVCLDFRANWTQQFIEEFNSRNPVDNPGNP